ncbi:MAG TPA: TVP38/TMEM64 family protein, partial [Thermoanaerobaculia bacterium]|nr:TVP38/TMEM64 family protein [Thermoanaerobaculia bacterium]
MDKTKRKLPWKWIALGTAALFLVAAGKLLPIGAWLQSFGEWISGLGPIGSVLYGVFYVIAALLFVPG